MQTLPPDPPAIVGRASVVDGDTIEIGGRRIRLHGIDAPESGQRCADRAGRLYRCGQRAAFALADELGAQTVRCAITGRDRWDRAIARCYARAGDVQAWMVSQGWAVAFRRYSREYVPQERAAQQAGAGMWAGAFVMPHQWRAGERLPTERPAPE